MDMPNQISVPNTHAVLDPHFAKDQMRHFAQWLQAGREITAYSADALLRTMKTAHRDLPDLVVIGALFRQVVATSDGCLVCLENGAIQAALLQARSAIEASLYLDWVLSKGKDRWATQYYVASIRQNRSWLMRLLPGTEEQRAYSKAYAEIGGKPLAPSNQSEIASEVEKLDELLNDAGYREINGWFEQASKIGKGKSQRRVEPVWHSPGPDGVASIAKLARALGREAEYITLYRYMSYFAHGSLADNHFRTQEGKAAVEPIRYPKQFALAFNNTVLLMLGATQRLLEEYRSGELPQFRERYMRKWREVVTNFVNVNIETFWIDV